MNTENNIAEQEHSLTHQDPDKKLFTCHLKKAPAEKDFVDDILKVNEEADGGNILLSSEQLKTVLDRQKDAITLYLKYDKEEAEPVLQGYAILLGLNEKGVEGFKAKEIKTVSNIIPSEHLSESLTTASAVYIVMIHGFDIRAQVEISMDVFDTISQVSDTALAQEGTSLGSITMERFGFEYLYGSPVIKFCEVKTAQFTEGMSSKMKFLNMIRKSSASSSHDRLADHTETSDANA